MHLGTVTPSNKTSEQVSLMLPTIEITPAPMYINHKLQQHTLPLKMFWFSPYQWVHIYLHVTSPSTTVQISKKIM
jgi:hypothetical protein